jgi:hypothetical protein
MTADATPLSDVLRSADDILAAMRARKESLGLSDALVDDLARFGGGRWSKAFGPSVEKIPNVVTLMRFADALGVSFIMVQDEAKTRRMQPRWQRRVEHSMRPARRVASAAIRRALPHAQTLLGIAGGKARWKNIAPADRRARMRALAMKRWAA